MKIVLAPDSFKDSLPAAEICKAMERGVRRVLPSAQTEALPLADGGEGTLDALTASTGGTAFPVRTTGPLGEAVDSRFAVLGDGKTAVVEMANASGLMLVPVKRRNPLAATSYGTGELIRAAVGRGPKKIIVCIGGSATSDCGTGMAQALGIRFFRADGTEIGGPLNGSSMGEAERLDASGLDSRMRNVEIVVACDVQNPLLGENGAVMVYSRQKGANDGQMAVLEKNMERIIGVVEKASRRSIRKLPGTGAAGGLAVPLIAFAGARLVPGIRLVLEAVRFSARIRDADLILTGEGKIDGQTLHGKTVRGVAEEGKKQNKPVIALAGCVEKGAEALHAIGVTSMFPICPGPVPLQHALQNAGEFVADTTERVIRLFISCRDTDL